MALTKATFSVTGMTCDGCVRAIERKLSATPGITSARVNLGEAKASIEYDTDVTDLSQVVAAVESLGYEVPAGSAS
jgi:copper chaperone CopZ